VLQNLRFYGRAYGLRRDVLGRRVQRALRSAGLEGRERARTKDLSGGWRQRLALGAAIIHHPELVFLDEPTAGVDPISRRVFWNLLDDLSADGVTIFVTTHYMDEAEHCHRLGFIQRGRLIAQGSPAEIKREEMQGQVLQVDCERPEEAVGILRRIDGLEDVALYGAQIHAVATEAQEVTPRIASRLAENSIGVQDIRVVEPSLEDVFTSIVRREADGSHL
jgi:ABC-2 type transport system ATP-binding protein